MHLIITPHIPLLLRTQRSDGFQQHVNRTVYIHEVIDVPCAQVAEEVVIQDGDPEHNRAREEGGRLGRAAFVRWV